MVCVYCGSRTQVVNSRLQKRLNYIWRRRKCSSCLAIFTTEEQTALYSSLMIATKNRLLPFNRDQLFTSIYDSCRHRPSSTEDASALTQTIISKLLADQSNGIIIRNELIKAAHEVLQRFDHTAAALYAAYHPTIPSNPIS